MAETVTLTPSVSQISELSENKGPINRILLIFQSTIQLDELSIVGDESNRFQKNEDVAGVEYPLIKINDYIFSQSEITNFNIDCTEFLPKINLSVLLTSQLFLAKEMPKDGDLISVSICNKSDVLRIIRNDYVITGVHVSPNMTEVKGPVMISFYGELFIPGLKSQKNDFSFEGTTLEAAKDFAKRYGLGFATNEDNTDDKQIWLKANIAGDIYINNLVERAWRDTKSFYKCWIDVYYNLNFININKQLMSAETSSDVAAMISNIDKNWNYGNSRDEEETTLAVKVFSNIQSFRTSSFYITSWRPLNRSSQVTFQIGTKMTCEIFEHNKYIYENPKTEKNKNYWRIPIEPTYDEDKVNKTILLRGRATMVPDEKNPDLQRANYSYVDLYEKFPWLGVQYTLTNSDADISEWDGNHHKNYQRAKVQNLINNKELDKLNLHVKVNGNNFNVIIADKIPVILIRTDAIDNMRINPESNFNDSLDLFYSGWYLVKGFILNWNQKNEDSIMSRFTHEFILTRREWPAPLPIEPIKVNEKKLD